MQPTPHRDHIEWASYNARFSALLTWLPRLCFWVVVGGSIYGIQKSIEAQHPGSGLIIAGIAAYIIQTLNRVSVHFSTRWIASWFFISKNRQYLTANRHQKIKQIDGFVGFLCLCFTASICYFDFQANKEASNMAAKNLVAKSDSIVVDKTANAQAIEAAQLAVSAAQSAENSERSAYEATVDADINRQRAKYAKRQAHLQSLSPRPRWADAELRNIAATLRNLETERRTRRAAFIPKTSGLTDAQRNLAKVSSDNSAALIALQTHADTTNIRNAITYEAKKESYSMAMFWLYITAMLIWHLCHGMKAYRALRYDESIPDNEHPIVRMAQTILDGANNFLWQIHAKILYWMPEEEIHSIARADLLARTNTPVCHDVFQHILQNQGINELVIYTNLRHRYEIDEIRQALRLLKTAKLLNESAHIWTANESQAQFFKTTPTATTVTPAASF
jgi:hypothetical protein